MEICPLQNPNNFERSRFFQVLKQAVSASVISTCLQCRKYPQCQTTFTLLEKSGAYIVESLSTELGGVLGEI